MEKKHKSRITAGILGLFLGVFGAQRFYLGSWLGIIFILMLFVSPMLAAIAGMIDGLFFLLMSDEQFDHNFNSGKSVERRVNRRNRGRRANRNSKQKNIRQQRRRKMNRPKNNPYKLSGQRKLQDYDLSGAIEDFNQGLKLDDEDKDIHYNLAKAHSLSENKELGFKHLSLAVAYGYSDLDGLAGDEGLAYLRIQPEYESFKANGFRSPTLEAPKAKKGDLLMQLNKLKELRDKGLISEREFAYEKSKLEQ